jgi:small subunit ribosomal protein S8
MMTDPIADMLSRIRNGLMVGHEKVTVHSSKMAQRLAHILKQTGFIEDFAVGRVEHRESLVLKMKYDNDGVAVIEGLKRVSRPGLRIYSAKDELPSVRGGLGIAVVSTSKGVMTCHEAKKLGIGGEILCYVW